VTANNGSPDNEPSKNNGVDVDSADEDSSRGSTPTRRRLLIGLTTAGGALGLGAGAQARGPAAAANNDQVGKGSGPPEQHIVGTSSQAGADEAARQAEEVRHVIDFGDDIGKAVAGRFPEQAREALARRPDVRYVEADATMEAIGQELPWGVDRVDASVAHDNGSTGDGADVAIIDTGVDSDHPDLVDNLGAGKAIIDCGTTYDGSSCSGNGNTCQEPWDDDNNHGTHCAGIAAAVDNAEGVIGVSKGSTLHPVKVLDCDGVGYLSDIAAGLEHTADQGWDVASMSLGSSSSSSTLHDACQYAVDQGVLVVAAAGNNGPCTDCVSYPAAYDTVVAVSATTSSDDLASFSSTGPEIDIAAPGSSILSTIPGGTAHFSGTSMACPHVSGAGALLMADGYTASEARSALQDSAEDIGLSSSDSGNGLLDAEAASTTTQNMIGESGTISVNENWTTVSLEGSYTDPVVVTSVGTFNDSDPVHSRVRNAGSGSFEVRLEEWDYQDGTHGSETINYVIMEAGTHSTEAGMDVVAGKATVDGSWTTVSYSPSWRAQSHAYTQVMSNNDSTPAVTRVTRAGRAQFDVVCQEQEANETWDQQQLNGHANETIGFIVTEPRSGDVGDTGESISSTISTDEWTTATLEDSYSTTPVMLHRIQSFFGQDPGSVRTKNVSSTSLDLMIQEEQSAENETSHVKEYVATMAFESGSVSAR
jgi:subtilisin